MSNQTQTQIQTLDTTEVQDVNELIKQRHTKRQAIIDAGNNPYPNQFKRTHYAQDLQTQFANQDKQTLADNDKVMVMVAGRIMLKRIMGKASFITLADMSGKIQAYVSKNDLGDEIYNDFKTWDIGDIVGIQGYLFRTNTGELSVHATTVQLLTKSLRPLPDKFHGLADTEARYRSRHLDLMTNDDSRKTFIIRSQVIAGIRKFMLDKRFMEVETPMMHVIPGGAVARPFVTHHNALDMPLFLRIAPELYLKRLVVGGFERVFEINRNFRNEGVSARHNPEFTMIEFYEAYADYQDLMTLTENMLETLAMDILGTTKLNYQGEALSFKAPFARLSMTKAIEKYATDFDMNKINDRDYLADYVKNQLHMEVKDIFGIGKLQTIIFEETAETKLRQPTFITEYPAETSPLARRNDDNPEITDRFELFIGGREIANGFSELNDPIDQAERFRQQVAEKDAGDDEAMHYDGEFIEALEYGLPPTAGEGIGIDRLVMLFANAPSIRDVILFPHMRRKE
ncbi:lysyl-tRNA ligase [Moraxella macacae 0408225]|uniref:Lysine--tRNA ligase n=1 Tax=Moraxella macacae 0408225 TaxID=1230338 RepID=L2F645_9GAMM|nr:lysine--tRNA ligase [Moraxella macacae]ELA08502.1 lysyl-tRNA ligase [Moraxella macacae 0408225]